MEEEIFYEDQEENKHFNRYRRWGKESDDTERESARDTLSPGYFDSIWEGRS